MDSKFRLLALENQIIINRRKKELEQQRMLEDHHREQAKEEYAHMAEVEKLTAGERAQELHHMAGEEKCAVDEHV